MSCSYNQSQTVLIFGSIAWEERERIREMLTADFEIFPENVAMRRYRAVDRETVTTISTEPEPESDDTYIEVHGKHNGMSYPKPGRRSKRWAPL